MKKEILISAIILLLGGALFAQTHNPSKVIRSTVDSLFYIKDGVREFYSVDSALYDEKGWLILLKTVDNKGRLIAVMRGDGERKIKVYFSYYTQKGNRLENFVRYDSLQRVVESYNLVWRYLSYYDNQGHLIERKGYTCGQRLFLDPFTEMDSIMQFCDTIQWKFCTSEKMVYKTNGNVIKILFWNQGDHHTTTYRHQQLGDTTIIMGYHKHRLYSKDISWTNDDGSYGTEFYRKVCCKMKLDNAEKYDSHGNMIYSYDGHYNTTSTYQYIYDSDGNWTQRKSYLFEQSTPHAITTRKIEYWK